jgi:hypothetical protein
MSALSAAIGGMGSDRIVQHSYEVFAWRVVLPATGRSGSPQHRARLCGHETSLT